LRKQIQLADGAIKEAGRAVNHAAMLLVPVRKTVSFVAFLVLFFCEFFAINHSQLRAKFDARDTFDGGRFLIASYV
jgi:hypothetical protein